MNPSSAIEVAGLSHRYGQRQALCDLSFDVRRGEIFAFLGPNGGGKTTLFRILSTLIPVQEGEVSILGLSLRSKTRQVRSRIGVVFQAPSIDKKLTVAENIRHQAALYGLRRPTVNRRMHQLAEQLGLGERLHELAETLSGGLRRRVELAKGMIHQPELLLMDEPSSGLDPAARSDLWQYLRQLRQQRNVTVALTTHLLEEADKADRIALLDGGRRVALDTPQALRDAVGGDSITIGSKNPHRLAEAIREKFNLSATVLDGNVRLEQAQGHQWIARLVEAFPQQIDAITLGKPGLEDVFIDRTGHRFRDSQDQ